MKRGFVMDDDRLNERKALSWELLRSFVAAFGAVWPYVLSALVGGMVSVAASRILSGMGYWGIAGIMLGHLGTGFIVAGIGVLFYEWNTHARDVASLTNELSELNRSVGENALGGSLRTLLRGDGDSYDDELVMAIQGFVEQLRELQTQGDWARAGYVRFLCRMQKDVTANAESLRRVSIELRKNPSAVTAYRVRVKSPGALTDIMLAEQMRRLPLGGRYSTASNPVAWHGNQLRELHSESRNAIARGVMIRRMFVLYAGVGPHGGAFDVGEAEDVIRSHFQDSQTWSGGKPGGYEIRLFDEVTGRSIERASRDFIMDNHYGTFEWPGADHAVLVQVTASDLSDLTITGLYEDSPHLWRWETVWAGLPVTTIDVVDKVLARWRARVQQA